MAPRPELFQLCPGGETIRAGRPRQLGYSRAGGGGAALSRWVSWGRSREGGGEEGGCLMSQERLCFFVLCFNSSYLSTARTWHFAVFDDQKNPTNFG